MKDTFWTMEYKNHWIRGHHDRDLKKEVITILTPARQVYDAKSIHAAKCRISRFLSNEVKK